MHYETGIIVSFGTLMTFTFGEIEASLLPKTTSPIIHAGTLSISYGLCIIQYIKIVNLL